MNSKGSAKLSYWEIDQYYKTFDVVIVGSGIVGLSAAISIREKQKNASVLILEKGFLPSGASTKNAGFACFGSPSELLDDLSKMPEASVWETVAMRWKGLNLLRRRVGDRNMDYQPNGGYEIFSERISLEACADNLQMLNQNLRRVVGLGEVYRNTRKYLSAFKGIKGVILNSYEGQIDTGKMMSTLLGIAAAKGIKILNNIDVSAIAEKNDSVSLQTNHGVFSGARVIVATNGFAARLLRLNDVKPARAQVLITRPIKNLKLKGTFHYEQGYYYFRNIHNRILFGGGRNTDPETETSYDIALNPDIHRKLDRLLGEMILPGVRPEIEHRWAGIMGIGKEKKPIIKFHSPKVLAAVRMGGMGVAIGSVVGEKAASLVLEA